MLVWDDLHVYCWSSCCIHIATEDFKMLKKNCVSNKCFIFIKQPLKMYHSLLKNIKHHNCFQKGKYNNVSWAANQHIWKISEWLCETKDWSNDAEHSALHHIRWMYDMLVCLCCLTHRCALKSLVHWYKHGKRSKGGQGPWHEFIWNSRNKICTTLYVSVLYTYY